MISVSVVIATRNEARRIKRCIEALSGFDEIVVLDSASDDGTADIARACGARVENFVWNGAYPKKRQWCLDNLTLKHDWVFFCDADEIVTPELKREMASLNPTFAGYFVRGRYVMNGRALRFGIANNKLALLHRARMRFPVVDDLDCLGMGEMEGHYQPVPAHGGRIGQLRAPLLHEAYDSREGWDARHARYAAWENCMNAKGAWPEDPVPARAALKQLFRALPGRGPIAFIHSYIMLGGFLDGRAGFQLAADRYAYYRRIK